MKNIILLLLLVCSLASWAQVGLYTPTGAVAGTTTNSSTGNIGIGNTDPQVKLDLGTTQGNGLQFRYDQSANYRIRLSPYWNTGTDTRLDFNIERASGQGFTTVMSVGYNNNVGIGTASPEQKLDVRGNLVLEAGGNPSLFTGTGTSELSRYLYLLNSSLLASASGLKAGGILVSDTYSFANPGKNDLIVKGNVGIGTNSPGLTAHVLGPLGFPASSGANQTGVLRLQGTGSNGVLDFSVNAGSGASLQVTNQTDLSQKYPLILNPNGGNVGIGTSNSPVSKLDVSMSSSNTNYGSLSSSDLGLFLKNASATNNNFNIISFGDAAGYGVAHIGAVFKDQTNHFGNLFFATKGSGGFVQRMIIDETGKVGIGNLAPDAMLSVSGQVHAQEIKVSIAVPGPDYVFEKDYKLTSLEEIKNYIDQNKHLPEVPSAKEMEKNGVQLGEMNMLLLKKIEELTLYLLDANKKIEGLSKKVELLEQTQTTGNKN